MNPNTRDRPSDEESIEARAAAWLAQRDAGWEEGEATKFEEWQAANPRHLAAVRRLAAVWSSLESLRDYRPNARIHPDPDLLKAEPAPFCMTGSALRWALPLAAVLVLSFAGWLHFGQPHRANEALVYRTTHGGFQRATLADGSVVEINSDTELRVSYSADERRLRLARGEAHFTVAKNQARPFWVETKGVAVRAVGTAFDVKVADRRIEILVTAGSVSLSAGGIPLQDSANSAPAVLTAGWRAIVSSFDLKTVRIEKMAVSGVREMLGWQSSRLSFVDMPLAEVIEQFNLRNEVQVALGSPELAGRSIGGSFASDNLDGFIRLLTSSGEIAAERPSPGQIVLTKVR